MIDPQYPIFVLGGVITDKDYADGPLAEAISEFKQEFWGTSEIVLHTSDIARNRNGFESLKDPDFRTRFYLRLNELMRRLEYQVVACAIRKNSHLEGYGELAINPYSLSLSVLVERFCFEVGNVAGGGMIVVEKRDPSLDRSLIVNRLEILRALAFLLTHLPHKPPYRGRRKTTRTSRRCGWVFEATALRRYLPVPGHSLPPATDGLSRPLPWRRRPFPE